MIYVDECEPVGEIESQFSHRKVTFKRNKDVRSIYEMINEIGRGKFGRVMKCRRIDSGEIFAAKFVTCTRREDRRNVEREVEIMNCLKSHKLLQLYESYDNGRSEMCLITEYIGGGELFDRVIEDEFVLSERACCIFTKQILEGVNYIHRQQIIHLDLKPENILCLTKSGNRVKIIDFGLARKFEPMKKLQILFGTPEFVAPEVVNFEPIGYSTDMWALGVITYVLVSGLSPFMGDTDLETMANVTIAEYDYEDEAFDNVSAAAKDFIDSLLVKDQSKRASAEMCLAHPWLKTINSSNEDIQLATENNLNVAKDNMSHQKTAWNNRDSNYYLFDSKSKTASQLYEMNLTIPPNILNLSNEESEGDQFSFFTADGTVRSDSNLLVTPEGKVTVKEKEEDQPVLPSTGGIEGVRKRSMDDVKPESIAEETIEYHGLVKRPKTPLITAGDIAKTAASLCERKQSACGSLPDVVSSSTLDNTEIYASRSSLLEESELPADCLEDFADKNKLLSINQNNNQNEKEIHDHSLPDILNSENDYAQAQAEDGDSNNLLISENELTLTPNLPPIVIEDLGGSDLTENQVYRSDNNTSEPVISSPCPSEGPGVQDIVTIEESCLDNQINNTDVNTVLSPDTPSTPETSLHCVEEYLSVDDLQSPVPVTKNYTVDDGFDRPDGGWGGSKHTQELVAVTEVNMSDDESDNEDEKSSSSSSLPSESSGIFYKAEYSPLESDSPVANNLLSVHNRDTYWHNFFNKTVADQRRTNMGVNKSSSGGCDPLGLPNQELPISKSKSDATINYIVQPNNEEKNKTVVQKLSHDLGVIGNQCSSIRNDLSKSNGYNSNIVLPRTLRSASLGSEIFKKPLTEISGMESPKVDSNDKLSSTISKEMHDLLSSIQSLGKREILEEDSSLSNSNSVSLRAKKENSTEKNVNMERLLQEVEDKIRFSATAELLERIAHCPDIETSSQIAMGMKKNKDSYTSLDNSFKSSPSQTSSLGSPLRRMTSPKSLNMDPRNNNFHQCQNHIDSPTLPDLVQATPDNQQGLKHLTSCPTPVLSKQVNNKNSQHPESPTKERLVSLARPSEMMTNCTRNPTFIPSKMQVPDMLAKVNCNSIERDCNIVSGGQSEYNINPQKSNQSQEHNNDMVNYNNYRNVCEDLSKVKSNIDNLRTIISTTKSDIQNTSKPLLDIFDKCEFYKDPKSVSSNGCVRGQVIQSSPLESNISETTNAMRDIEKTVQNFSKQCSLPNGKVSESQTVENGGNNGRKIFSRARQGSVTRTKDKFEQRSVESRIPIPLQGPKQRSTTPFYATRSPSPTKQEISQTFPTENNNISPTLRSCNGTGTRLNLRKRSPSPVVTGKVSSFRNKFENIPARVLLNNNSATLPRNVRLKSREPREIVCQRSTPAPDASSSKMPHLSLEQNGSSQKLNSLSRQTSGNRLPAHFVNIHSSPVASCGSSTNLANNCTLHSPGNTRPIMARTLSVRASRPSVGSITDTATKNAANFLRSTLPRKSLPETTDSNRLRGPFGYNHI